MSLLIHLARMYFAVQMIFTELLHQITFAMTFESEMRSEQKWDFPKNAI